MLKKKRRSQSPGGLGAVEIDTSVGQLLKRSLISSRGLPDVGKYFEAFIGEGGLKPAVPEEWKIWYIKPHGSE